MLIRMAGYDRGVKKLEASGGNRQMAGTITAGRTMIRLGIVCIRAGGAMLFLRNRGGAFFLVALLAQNILGGMYLMTEVGGAGAKDNGDKQNR